MSAAVLRPLSREALHRFRRRYAPDPHGEAYAYDPAAVDAEFEAGAVPNCVRFAVEADGEIIGIVNLRAIDRAKGRCTLGILLADERCRGRGLGQQACAQALDYAFGTLGLQAVYAETLGGNARMRRVLEKLGFVCYLRMEEAVRTRSGLQDLLYFRRCAPQ